MKRYETFWEYLLYSNTDYYRITYVIAFFILARLLAKKNNRDLWLLTLYVTTIILFEQFITKWEIYYYGNSYMSTNIYANATIPIHFLLFYQRPTRSITWTLFFAWLVSLFYCISAQDWTSKVASSYLIGMTFNAICVFLYLRSFLLAAYKPFWSDNKLILGFGILLFFLSVFPLLVFSNNLLVESKSAMAFHDILLFGNVILAISVLVSAIVLWMNS